jgi:MFS family permease
MQAEHKIIKWISAELFFVVSVISSVMFGVFSAAISHDFHLSPSTLGWLSGIFFIVYALAQFYSGRLFVLFPAWIIMSSSALIAALGALVFANCSSIGLVFLARILLGVGLASTFVGVLYIVQKNFAAASFPMMSSLSQSSANFCAAIFGFFAGSVHNYHTSFNFLALLLLICSLLSFLFIREKSTTASSLKQAQATPQLSMLSTVSMIIRNPQVWLAAFYFSGLFGAVLTFADLFNVSYQVQAFHLSFNTASIINSMIPLGLTCGGLLCGYWAQKIKNYVFPARIMGALTVAMFSLILFIKFESAFAHVIIGVVSFLFGIGCSGSILAFQCLQENISDERLKPMATSFVLTFTYIMSGMVEQPTVGDFIARTQLKVMNHAAGLSAVQSWFFYPADQDSWHKFNSGLYVIFGFLIVSFIASWFFKRKQN